MADFTHQSTGLIKFFTGESCEELFNLTYNIFLSSTWTNSGSGDPNYNLEFESTWNVDSPQYHWYRVIGSNRKSVSSSSQNSDLQDWYEYKCQSGCSPTNETPTSPKLASGDLASFYETQDTSCGSKNIFTLVAAQNLKQLCEKLKDPNFGPPVNFKINSIKRRISPIGQKTPIDFVDEDFCSCPECLDFCLDYDFTNYNYQKCVSYQPIGGYMSSSFIYSFETTGAISIGGSAEILYYWFPNYPIYITTINDNFLQTISGFNIVISNTSIITISGSAEVVSPAFVKIGAGSLLVSSSNLDYLISPLFRTGSGFLDIGGYLEDVVSNDQKYTATGGIELISDNIENKVTFIYNVSNCINYINFGGSSQVDILNLNYIYQSQGILTTSGTSEFESSYYSYQPSSSLIQIFGSIEDIVSGSWKYQSTGILDISGTPLRISRQHKSFGSLSLFGSFYNIYKIDNFNSSGSVFITGGVSDVISPDQNYKSQGSIFISGSSSYNFTNLGLVVSYSEIYSAIFGSKLESKQPDSFSTTINTGSVSVCGCALNNLVLRLNQNIANSGVLNEFLKRNNLKIDSILDLRYKKSTNSWCYSQHLNGRGPDGKSSEHWYVTFDLTCTNNIANQNYSNPYFKFNMFVRRQNSTQKISEETKLSVNINVMDICVNKSILTSIQYNSFNEKFIVDDLENQSGKFYDQIGLFKNTYWNNKKDFSKVRLRTEKSPQLVGIFPTFSINIPSNIMMQTIPLDQPQPIIL